MSTYHYAVKKLLSEIEKFINITLKSENLSKQAVKEKDKILESLQKLFADYISLAPSGDEGSTSSAKDTGGNSSIGEDSQMTVDSSHGSEEDNYSDNVPDTTVKALTNPTKMGYLEKKNTGTLLGNIFSWKKRYCVLHKNILYCYKKPDDKKQQCAFYLNGYEFREAPQNHKDAAKKDFCFELVSPGKKSHQFLGSSKEDVSSWKDAFQSASINSTESIDMNDGEDIYEEMPADKPPVKRIELPVSVAVVTNETTDEIYEDGTSMVTEIPTPMKSKEHMRPSSPLPVVTTAVAKSKEVEDYEDDDIIYEPVDTPAPSAAPLAAPSAAPLAAPVRSSVPETPPPLPPHVPHMTPTQTQASSSELPPPLPSRNVPLPPPPSEQIPQLPQPRKKTIALGNIMHPSEDFENMFYGIWKSESSSSQELTFDRGQIIHVISRDLDSDDWWVGELEGKIGLVPKTYLTPAYELVH